MSQETDYSKINKQHILDAVSKIEAEGIELEPSTKFDVKINGKLYPPKEIMRYSNQLANGTMEWPFAGGEPTNKFLTGMGFEIFPKANISTMPQVEIPLSGNVWKLGVRWGTGMPNFYNFIKANSIVIGVNGLNAGDLVVIAEGHTVYALAKVNEQPKSVTTIPEFKLEFDQHKIDYNSGVKVATAEWYELDDGDIFEYKLQQGICRVNDPTTRNTAFSLWRDRFANYWIFQGNPAEYDFVKAVNENVLDNWTVTAHKDKIKTGDKVILWLGGKKSGCYALASITSPPEERPKSSDDYLWKTAPKPSLKAGIQLTHNLSEKPLLWQSIKETKGLEGLNVGNRGTNFTATKQQYKTILNLIDKFGSKMTQQIDIFQNTILYGPPGTGKTFRLNDYKNKYFTDEGISRSSDEVLKERVSSYQLWKVIGAVLGTAAEPMLVKDIVEHPIVKAKINPNNKAKPNALVWNDLQAYADDHSTQVDGKYRRQLQLFHKEEKSNWTIMEDKKTDLADILGQELLDLATNPAVPAVSGVAIKTRYNFITFHQKYSYEDFIEGIKPVLAGDSIYGYDNDLQFELKKGVFYNSCLEALRLVGYSTFIECYNDTEENRYAKFAEAKKNPTMQYALFIDEINRANISAVFGELITLLEDDKRIGADNEMWVDLPYSNEKFCVPSNLYVIGTMNTADRSIALLDIALRRRFEFKALYPEYVPTEWWASLLEALNLAIYNWRKNPDFFIGHAFFINKLEGEKNKVLNTKIIPLLYEYCQNNADTVKKILMEAGIQLKQTGIRENFQIIAE